MDMQKINNARDFLSHALMSISEIGKLMSVRSDSLLSKKVVYADLSDIEAVIKANDKVQGIVAIAKKNLDKVAEDSIKELNELLDSLGKPLYHSKSKSVEATKEPLINGDALDAPTKNDSETNQETNGLSEKESLGVSGPAVILNSSVEDDVEAPVKDNTPESTAICTESDHSPTDVDKTADSSIIERNGSTIIDENIEESVVSCNDKSVVENSDTSTDRAEVPNGTEENSEKKPLLKLVDINKLMDPKISASSKDNSIIILSDSDMSSADKSKNKNTKSAKNIAKDRIIEEQVSDEIPTDLRRQLFPPNSYDEIIKSDERFRPECSSVQLSKMPTNLNRLLRRHKLQRVYSAEGKVLGQVPKGKTMNAQQDEIVPTGRKTRGRLTKELAKSKFEAFRKTRTEQAGTKKTSGDASDEEKEAEKETDTARGDTGKKYLVPEFEKYNTTDRKSSLKDANSPCGKLAKRVSFASLSHSSDSDEDAEGKEHEKKQDKEGTKDDAVKEDTATAKDQNKTEEGHNEEEDAGSKRRRPMPRRRAKEAMAKDAEDRKEDERKIHRRTRSERDKNSKLRKSSESPKKNDPGSDGSSSSLSDEEIVANAEANDVVDSSSGKDGKILTDGDEDGVVLPDADEKESDEEAMKKTDGEKEKKHGDIDSASDEEIDEAMDGKKKRKRSSGSSADEPSKISDEEARTKKKKIPDLDDDIDKLTNLKNLAQSPKKSKHSPAKPKSKKRKVAASSDSEAEDKKTEEETPVKKKSDDEKDESEEDELPGVETPPADAEPSQSNDGDDGAVETMQEDALENILDSSEDENLEEDLDACIEKQDDAEDKDEETSGDDKKKDKRRKSKDKKSKSKTSKSDPLLTEKLTESEDSDDLRAKMCLKAKLDDSDDNEDITAKKSVLDKHKKKRSNAVVDSSSDDEEEEDSGKTDKTEGVEKKLESAEEGSADAAEEGLAEEEVETSAEAEASEVASEQEPEIAEAEEAAEHDSDIDPNAVRDSSDDSAINVKRKPSPTRRDSESSDAAEKEDKRNASDSDSDIVVKKRKRRVKKKKEDNSDASDRSSDSEKKNKRKRIKRIKKSDSSASGSGSGSGSGSDGDSHSKGRKNIRKVLKTKNLDEATLQAAREEKERKQRIEERQKMYNSLFDGKLMQEAKVDKLVLDFDPDTKKELVAVHKRLVKQLKPHQATGIKFMFDACFESIKQIEKGFASGCILAHCMGLGKSLQVVALVHTLIMHAEITKVRCVLVVCPLSTVLNWVNEFKIWLKNVNKGEDVNIYELSSFKKNNEREFQLRDWQDCGGVMIMGYDMFRNLSSLTDKRIRKKMKDSLQRCLIDPGPDLVVCDEGHLLKNEKTRLSQAMTRIKTLRRIVLTGTPLQNNLKEYYCMMQFVKPNLLGKYTEYMNRFVNPITNGQYTDSTPRDIAIMKRRSHVLHKMLDGCVQRRDYSVLAPYLPPKHEYVLFLNLTELQIKLYQFYLDNFARRAHPDRKNSSFLFPDFQNFQRIWTHPRVLRANSERYERDQNKKAEMQSDSEGSLKDFIDDSKSESDSDTKSSEVSDASDDSAPSNSKRRAPTTRGTRASRRLGADEVDELSEPEQEKRENPTEWWMPLCPESELDYLHHSAKLVLLFDILKECEAMGDKILIFSQSLYSLDVIEHFLAQIDEQTQRDGVRVDEEEKEGADGVGDKGETGDGEGEGAGEGDKAKEKEKKDKLLGHRSSWSLGLDYFRLDGSTSCENRAAWCKSFNRPDNFRARLFLISTRAGGLGINLVSANRVIIFDVSWNPSHDVQSIFRVYRFGQKKPCYIYRFIARGTMEEKVYERQVTKQAISKRVIDEQQIDRHYNSSDLNELYKFEPVPLEPRPTPNLPKDRLFAEMLQKHESLIYHFHEHDSLLENKEEETLNEDERRAAWEEFENEKKAPPPMVMQQQNFGKAASFGTSSTWFGMRTDVVLSLLTIMVKQDNPMLTDDQIKGVIPTMTERMIAAANVGDFSIVNRMKNLLAQHQSSMMQQQYGALGSAYGQQPVGYYANPASGAGGEGGGRAMPTWMMQQQMRQQQLLLQQQQQLVKQQQQMKNYQTVVNPFSSSAQQSVLRSQNNQQQQPQQQQLVPNPLAAATAAGKNKRKLPRMEDFVELDSD